MKYSIILNVFFGILAYKIFFGIIKIISFKLCEQLTELKNETQILKAKLFNIARDTLLCLEYYNRKGCITDTLWQSPMTTLYDYLMSVGGISEEEMKKIEQEAKEKSRNENIY